MSRLFLGSLCFVILGLLTACGPETKPVELEVLLYNKVVNTTADKYPKALQEICKPLSEVGLKQDEEFRFEPISLKRADLNRSFQIEYLDNKAGDPGKIKFVNRQLEHYFADNYVNEILAAPSVPAGNVPDDLTRYKTKKNYFIFSSDEDVEVAGKDVCHSIKELRAAISKFLGENDATKVVIVFEPLVKPPPSLPPTPAPKTTVTPSAVADEDAFAVYQQCKDSIRPGADHDASFELLEKAAALAIKQGKATELLNLINTDLANDAPSKRGIWSLSTHPHHWEPVKSALANNDASLLHGHKKD